MEHDFQSNPNLLFLDTIPEDQSVAVEAEAARVANLSAASAVASSDSSADDDLNLKNKNKKKNNKRSRRLIIDCSSGEGPRSETSGASDTQAVLEGGGGSVGGATHHHASRQQGGTEQAPGPSSSSSANNNDNKNCTKKTYIFYGVLLILLAGVGAGIYFIVGAVSSSNSNDQDFANVPSPTPTDDDSNNDDGTTFPPFEIFIDSEVPTSSPSTNLADVAAIDEALLKVTVTTASSGGGSGGDNDDDIIIIYDTSTPQGKCRYWLTHQDAWHVTVELDGEQAVQQRYILCVFYHTTNGLNWDMTVETKIESIFFMDKETHECDWAGVSCDKGRVAVLHLPNFELQGSLPQELTHLSHLQALSLFQNSLSGSIPSTLLSLSKLFWVDLSENALTGVVPSSSSSADDNNNNSNNPALQGLYLYDQQDQDELGRGGGGGLTGRVPYFPNLEQLWVQGNSLTGVDQIEKYATSTTLKSWIMYDNAISNQPLPTIWNAPNLVDLDLALNDWTGSIPESLLMGVGNNNNNINNLPMLQSLLLHDAQLTGTLPEMTTTTTTTSTSLQHVWLHSNLLSGEIPLSFGWNWQNLSSLLLHDNPNLSGKVDASMCQRWGLLERLEADCAIGLEVEEERVSCACCTTCHGGD